MKPVNLFYTFICLAGLISWTTNSSIASPVPIIFDTDISGDVDDALALAMLHSLADRRHCEILAVTISKKNELAPAFVDALNTFYGRPDIPIGYGTEGPPRESPYLKIVREKVGDQFRYPHDMGVTAEPEDALALLKKTLEAAEDGSVAIVQVGTASNIAQLIESDGGKDLVRRKVYHLSVMAGAFQTIVDKTQHREANVVQDIPAMRSLVDHWPGEVPIIWSGFEIGLAAPFPSRSIVKDLDYVAHHPVKEAYLLHSGPNHNRPTWDLTSVLYSVFPDRGYFDLSGPGRVTVSENAVTEFFPKDMNRWGNGKGFETELPREKTTDETRDRFLVMSPVQAARVQEALVHFVVQPPASMKRPENRPVKLIFDTDMGNDIDDAMALAMIHTLERRGACELLAVTSTKDHPKSAAYIDAVNTFYGRPDIPIGVVRDGVTPELGKFNGLADHYPHDLKSGDDAPNAVTLLRKTLAAQPDQSVTIAQVGFFTNLAALLESGPDEISPLSGVELAEKKVKLLVVMAGSFQTIRHNNRYREYNVWKHIPPARSLTQKWPNPMVWSGFEIGIAAAYPWQSIMEDFENARPHPIKESYLAYAPEHPHDRPTWDLTAVLQAVYPDRGYFTLSPRGKVNMSEDGVTFFQPTGRDPSKDARIGRDQFFIMDDIQTSRVREALVQLTSEPPTQ